jgi:hypothetical protein
VAEIDAHSKAGRAAVAALALAVAACAGVLGVDDVTYRTADGGASDAGGVDGGATADAFTDGGEPPDAGAGAGAYVQAVLKDSPIGYWRLDDPIGAATMAARVGTAGSYAGSVELQVPGLLPSEPTSTAANFGVKGGGTAGVSDSRYDFADKKPFSVEAWVSLQKDQNNQDLVTTQTNGKMGWTLYQDNTGELLIERDDGTDSDSASVAAPTKPTHVVATYDGTQLQLYLNGNAVGPSAPSTRSLPAPASHLRLGAGNVAVDPLHGILDEVAVYATALTPDRIQAHYQAGTP